MDNISNIIAALMGGGMVTIIGQLISVWSKSKDASEARDKSEQVMITEQNKELASVREGYRLRITTLETRLDDIITTISIYQKKAEDAEAAFRKLQGEYDVLKRRSDAQDVELSELRRRLSQ